MNNHKIYYFQYQKAITLNIDYPELWFLHFAHCLMLVNICVKVHEDSLNGFSGHNFVTDRQVNKQTDKQMDRGLGKNNMSSYPKEGRHNNP